MRTEARNDWFAVGAYALVAAVSQTLWLTYAPITTEAAAHFGASETAVGWLAEVFPLIYVLLAIPAGVLLDRWMRQTLVAAAALMAVGAAVRFAGGFSAALTGQVLIAVAQPAILAAVTKVAAESVEPARRTTAISIGAAGVFAGLVIALVLGATVGAADELRPLLLIDFVLAVAALLVIAVAMRRPFAREAGERVAIGARELRDIYSDPVLGRLAAMVFLGMGVFNGIATWLEVLLDPAGVSTSTAGWLLVSLTVAGIAGALLLPVRIARRRVERGYLQVAALVGAAAFATLAVADATPVAFVALSVLGFFLLAAQPVILEISERRAAHAAASAAGAIYLGGNLGGIVLAVLVQSVNDQPQAAFVLMGLAMLLLAPIARSLRPGFDRPPG